MIIAFAVFPYLIGGIVMWLVAHQVAPIGYNISLTRGVCAVAIMSCGSAIADYFLRPVMGDWSYAAQIVVSAILGMVILRLTFWRTLLVVVVYWVVFVVAVVVIAIIFKAQGNTRPAASGDGVIAQLCQAEANASHQTYCLLDLRGSTCEPLFVYLNLGDYTPARSYVTMSHFCLDSYRILHSLRWLSDGEPRYFSRIYL